MTVADAFKQARELILNDELAKTAIVYTHGARSMSTADLDSKVGFLHFFTVASYH